MQKVRIYSYWFLYCCVIGRGQVVSFEKGNIIIVFLCYLVDYMVFDL